MAMLRKTRLQLTRLEDREVPAGSVLNYGSGSFNGTSGPVNLAINFTGPNAFAWSTSPTTMPAASAAGTATVTGNLTVSLNGCGPNSAGTPGMQGNSLFINMNGQSLTGNLTILMGPCNDRVILINGSIMGQVTISTNAGDDQVFVSAGTAGPITIGKSLAIAQDGGNDTTTWGGALVVGGNTSVNMGAGNNTYNMATQFNIGGNMTMLAGGGLDPVNLLGAVGSTVGGAFFASLGNGNNDINLDCGLTIGGNTTYVGGTGSDNVEVGATIGGNLLALLGAGSDTFTYSAPPCIPFVGGTAFIDGGPGNDVYLPLTLPSWPNTVINIP